MTKNIITFGEPLLVNYFNQDKLFSKNNTFLCLGGSEINTSVSLSKNHNVFLLSSLPNNLLGDQFIEILNNYKIITNYIYRSNEHLLIGSMHVINNQVVYQRQYSSFSFLNNLNINLENISHINFHWCHMTGITPLLGTHICLIWKDIIFYSLELKIPVSLDLNYRPSLGKFDTLWDIVKPFLPHLELLIISISDILLISEYEKINMNNISIEKKLLLIANKLKINKLVMCYKEVLEDSTQNRCSYLIHNNIVYKSHIKKHKPIEPIGGGDSFVASLINDFINLNFENFEDNIISILDTADNYTIVNQNFSGHFPYLLL